MTRTSETDCRTEEGVTVGLIDALLCISRVLAPRLTSPGFSTPIAEALRDFWADRDVQDVQRAAVYLLRGDKREIKKVKE